MSRRSFFRGILGSLFGASSGVVRGAAVDQSGKGTTSIIRLDAFLSEAEKLDASNSVPKLDVSTSWQRAFDTVRDDGVIIVPPGVYRLGRGVKLSGKNNIRLLMHGVRVLEYGANLDAVITVSECTTIWIDGLSYEGEETYSTFSSGVPAERKFVIWVERSSGVRIANSSFKYKRGFIRLEECKRSSVVNCEFTGFFASMQQGSQRFGNECPAIEIRGGRNNKVLACSARNHGSCVLIGRDSVANFVFGCDAEDMHDNVVYISSGYRNRVVCIDGERVSSQLVKMRGGQNVVLGSSAEQSRGIAVTGNGAPGKSTGNGSGNVVLGNSLRNVVDSDAINFGSQDGFFQDNLIVALNVVENVQGKGYSGVRGGVTKNAVITGNVIAGVATGSGVLLAGDKRSPSKGAMVALNLLDEVKTARLIQVQHVNRPVVALNSGAGMKNNAALTRECMEPLVFGNWGEASSGPTPAASRVGVDFKGLATPSYLGQIVVFGRDAYVAIGMNEGDWRKITN